MTEEEKVPVTTTPPLPDAAATEVKETSADSAEAEASEENAVSDAFFERLDMVADPKQSLIRIDKFLIDRLSNRSRNKVQSAIRAGSVLVDDREVKPNYKVKPGNRVSIILPRALEDVFEIVAQDIKLDVVYEDDQVLVINKPNNIAVHPGVGIPNGTVVNAVSWHLKQQAEQLPVKAGNEPSRAGIVHRIDKDTSGLMVIAKKEFAMVHLANQFFHHTIERRYWALVWGDPAANSGTVVGNIGRNPNDRRMFMVFPEGEEGKHAITHWRVLERFHYVTLIECRLETGRTHQIRVHMKYIGHTLFGDPRYGGNQILKGTVYSKYRQFVEKNLAILPRQALHAKVLGFMHPITNEHIRFESELPKDMEIVINRWREYVDTRKKML
jgi:23S rRNA pseudouridine1911/1915/1917 synthase